MDKQKWQAQGKPFQRVTVQTQGKLMNEWLYPSLEIHISEVNGAAQLSPFLPRKNPHKVTNHTSQTKYSWLENKILTSKISFDQFPKLNKAECAESA